MARVFAVMAQILLNAGAIAVQTQVQPLLNHGTEFGSKALAQYRGTNFVEATFESRYKSLLAGR
jgi:hypothetical protein